MPRVGGGGRRGLRPAGPSGVQRAARVRVAPAWTADAVGGPLIDESGKAAGIVGGSLTPGARVGERALATSPWLWRLRPAATSATAFMSGR